MKNFRFVLNIFISLFFFSYKNSFKPMFALINVNKISDERAKKKNEIKESYLFNRMVFILK